MNRFIQISTILILFLFVSGCLLPIPHKRTCRAGYEGIVTDALTGVPITNATVTIEYLGGTNIITQTDSHGRLKISEDESWHGLIFVGIPMSYSLLPTFKGTSFPIMIMAEAQEYKKWSWHSWVDPFEIDNVSIADPIIDPHHIKLLPQKVSNDYRDRKSGATIQSTPLSKAGVYPFFDGRNAAHPEK